MNTKKNLLLLLIGLSLTILSCTKQETCIGVYELTESNENEAQLQCLGLANDYPNMKVISDVLISTDCDAYEEDVKLLISTNWCGVKVSGRKTIYKK